MRLFNGYTSLFAPKEGDEGEGSASGSQDESKPSKIKVSGKEYEESNLASAVSLYEALQDPETGKEIVTTLARKAGLLDKDGEIERKPGETKKQAESRAAGKLKNKLGKDYEKFADMVGPVLDELIAETIGEFKETSKAETAKGSWESAVDTFVKNNDFTSEVESAMQEIIEEGPPAFNRKGFDAQKYLNRVYKQACEDVGFTPKGREKTTRRSTKDFSDDFPDVVEKPRPAGVTLDDAIEAAMKGIRFKSRS